MKKNFFNLQLFADFPDESVRNTQKTTTAALSPTMKTFYDTSLLENARGSMLFSQFAKKQKMKGNKCEWRRFNRFQKATKPLEEGVVPAGSNLGMVKVEATVNQYGDYTTVSDRLEMEGYDDTIFNASEEMGAAMGETFDTLTRNAVSAGNSVWYGGNKAGRAALTEADKLTPTLVNKAATWLKKNNVPKIDGYYIALIHPCVAEDLRESDGWKEAHQYAAVKQIFDGEIGELHGVRFIECNDAMIVKGGETGALSVFVTLFFGKDAYGECDVEGEGKEMIVKSRKEIGGPLEQFSTIGYKFCHAAAILYQERLLRVETASSYTDEDAN